MKIDPPFDVVFTWVDDRFSGYRELLTRHASSPFDQSPNRTRDNLDLLKYSLRSLERFAPWLRRVTIVSMRPQVPAWLNPDAPGLRIVHHDAFMPPAVLPTFNSFAIVSCLHLIPDLSPRFLYFEDDMLLNGMLTPADLVDRDNRPLMFPQRRWTTSGAWRARSGMSPWNLALAQSNWLLDRAYGPAPRHAAEHLPLLIERDGLAATCAKWPDEVRRTRQSRFRAAGNIAPEYLYQYHQFYEGRAAMADSGATRRMSGYHALRNNRLINAACLALACAKAPRTLTLNDDFGAAPHPGVINAVRRFLERKLPTPSRFERIT